MSNAARIWEETIILPTYPAAKPEKSPLFIEKRAYQGSTGKVYPLPVTEKVSDEKVDMPYKAVWLENEYLKVMVLPELGGRIHRAYDKTNGYDFVYYNQVVKPALVGLTGPWISGGIEFNWPQHHRPSTFCPQDYTLRQNEDGSVTVFVGETDKMYGTKGMAAISLYPGKAYIEIKGQLYNHTDLPQTFLWWANPAVPVNDYTYSVFPPDVNSVFDHGKRAVSTFPIATGEYYKFDYSSGVDISRYKNVPVPTSYMVAHSDFDFIGNYDESREAGLLHVADHHVNPGKKQWTWGNGDFGRAWDRNLTDEDGPYIELMTGMFCDNQPDFTWLKPHEEKTFTQYFMPYKGVGRVGNATKEAAVSLVTENGVKVKVYATACYENAAIRAEKNGEVLLSTTADLSPVQCWEAPLNCDGIEDVTVTVTTEHGRVLVAYEVYEPELQPIPDPADPLPTPDKLKSMEELYLAATHLEQYRHATFEPADYYLEGLRRDATDIRINNGYGLLLYKRGHVKQSIPYFQRAIKKQIWKNPNPYAGECCFNLGLALAADGQDDKAYDAFYKATWSSETQGQGFYWLASIDCKRGEYEKALEFVSKSMVSGWHNMKARTLKAAILRKLGRSNAKLLEESIEIDPLYMGCLYEKALSDGDLEGWKQAMRGDAHNYLELALDYMKAGLYEDAITILESCQDANPLLKYYQGYVYSLAGKPEAAVSCCKDAEKVEAMYCFPNRVEEIAILEHAIAALDAAPQAHALLGCLLYDKKQYEAAVSHWETSVQEDPSQAMVYRNLSIAYYNKRNDLPGAMEQMEKALALDPSYPRLLLEYDQLAAKLCRSNAERLALLEGRMEVTAGRDDLYLRYITLLNCEGRYQDAYNAIMSRTFHPWEGGEGKASAQYKFSLIHMAMEHLEKGEADAAIEKLRSTLVYPHNLGEGKLFNVPDNQAWYLMGKAYRMKGEEEKAMECFAEATTGDTEPGSVLYYNDQPSDFIYFQGLAHRELGNEHAAKKAFYKLIAYGEKHIFDEVGYDFFAVSLPEIEVYADDIALRSQQYCRYLRALGHKGVGETEKAETLLTEVLKLQPEHQGALEHKN